MIEILLKKALLCHAHNKKIPWRLFSREFTTDNQSNHLQKTPDEYNSIIFFSGMFGNNMPDQ